MSNLRISTANAYEAAVTGLQQRQREVADTQQQVASGKRVQRGSDDPIAAARAERALAVESRNSADQRAVEASRTAMMQGESALGDATDLLQQAREAIVASGSGIYTDSQRSVLAAQLRDVRQQLLGVANRDDGSGARLFAGQGSGAQPFLDRTGGVTFQGMRGAASADADGRLPLTIDGASAFLSAPTGNGSFETRAVASHGSAWIDAGRVTDPSALSGAAYTLQFSAAGGASTYAVLKDGAPTAVTAAPYVAGQPIVVDGQSVTISGTPADGDAFGLAPSTPTQNMFDLLERTAAELATPSRTPTQRAQATTFALRDLDAVLARVTAARSEAGNALVRIASTGDRLDAATLDARLERSSAEDVDLIAAYSDLQSRQTGYQAALKSYATVQRLSLFDYLSR